MGVMRGDTRSLDYSQLSHVKGPRIIGFRDLGYRDLGCTDLG